MLRVIQELKPRWVVGENVAGIVNMALDTVLSDLENLGYPCQAFIIPACAVDAPHRRDRCAIVANSIGRRCGKNGKRGSMETIRARGKNNAMQATKSSSDVPDADNARNGTPESGADGHRAQKGGEQQPQFEHCGYGENVAYTYGKRLQVAGYGPKQQTVYEENRIKQRSCSVISDTDNGSGNVRWYGELPTVETVERTGADNRKRTPQYVAGEWRPAKSRLGRGAYELSCWLDSVRRGWGDGSWEYGLQRIARGVPNRVDRLKCLGNAVVPAQFYPIFKAIAELSEVGA